MASGVIADVSVQVKDRSGDIVGALADAASFLAWRRDMRKRCGGKVAAAVDENHIVDSAREWAALPVGEHEAVLVMRVPIPPSHRKKWSGHELWKAV